MAIAPGQVKLDLIDHHGQPFTTQNLAGRHSLTYFGFLHCKVVCPRSLAKLALIDAGLKAEKRQIRVLYISVDPTRDTPEAMRAFLDVNFPSFTGLTGPTAAIEAAKKSLNVFSRRIVDPDETGNYLMPHTAWVYLINEQGRYDTHFADHLSAEEIVSRLVARLPPALVSD